MHKSSTYKAIGLFDSGLGGLTILNEIHRRLPNEQLIYLADSNNAPYGEKPSNEIVDISKKNTEFLLSKGCKLIVVACNTATTNAISILRRTYDVPFIGIEPAIKPAALSSRNSSVGVLATKGTLTSELFSETAKKFTANTKVVEVIGKGIVEAIESNSVETEEFQKLLLEQLSPFKEAGIDTLVLGCSHYPFIMPYIQKILGQGVTIIDSGFAVAKQTERILKEFELESLELENMGIVSIHTNKTSKEALNTILKKLNLNNCHILNN